MTNKKENPVEIKYNGRVQRVDNEKKGKLKIEKNSKKIKNIDIELIEHLQKMQALFVKFKDNIKSGIVFNIIASTNQNLIVFIRF